MDTQPSILIIEDDLPLNRRLSKYSVAKAISRKHRNQWKRSWSYGAGLFDLVAGYQKHARSRAVVVL